MAFQYEIIFYFDLYFGALKLMLAINIFFLFFFFYFIFHFIMFYIARTHLYLQPNQLSRFATKIEEKKNFIKNDLMCFTRTILHSQDTIAKVGRVRSFMVYKPLLLWSSR